MTLSISSVVCGAILVLSVVSSAIAQKYPKDENGETIYPEAMYMLDSKGKLRLENLTEAAANDIEPKDVLEKDVILFLHTRRNMHNATQLGINDLDILQSSTFDANKKSMFVVHGWTCDCDHETVTVIVNAAVLASDMNVFCVDWGKDAKLPYMHAAKKSVPQVGRFLSVFLNRIMSEMDVRADYITLVGHSLGAHVVGKAGSLMTTKCNIVGLDPAGPLFLLADYDGRIDKTDGEYVQILHTNAGYLGFDGDIGHADFWANDGTSQPGCKRHVLPPQIISCAHNRSPKYHAESLSVGVFKSLACKSYSDFRRGKCAGNPTSYMGGVMLDTKSRGRYYFETYSSPPYAKG